jgi:glycosyltransferase involved in cell wall biosynthesis
MDLKNKLQIILITYNRLKFVKRTFEQFFFADNCPVKDFDILAIDNNSTDGTGDYLKQLATTHKHLTYRKNNFNIGGNANIATAIYSAKKEIQYTWVICDDDIYHFENWGLLEKAIDYGHEIICVCNDVFKHLGDKVKIEHLLYQGAFVPAMIYKTSLLTDSIVQNCFDNVFCWFPHMSPLISFINSGKEIYILDKPLVQVGELTYPTDGHLSTLVFPIGRYMYDCVGYGNIISGLKDKKLRHKYWKAVFECRGRNLLHISYFVSKSAIVHPFGKAHWHIFYSSLSYKQKVVARAGYFLRLIFYYIIDFYTPEKNLLQIVVFRFIKPPIIDKRSKAFLFMKKLMWFIFGNKINRI